jgi:glycine/D-amino acid oxidase-like deaminating enzyme
LSDPRRFCTFLKTEIQRRGVQIILDAQVTNVHLTKGNLTFVSVIQDHITSSLECSHLVIAAGPWSGRVLETIFPSAKVNLSFNQDSMSGNYLIVKNPSPRRSKAAKACHQVYMKGIISRPVDISNYLDGRIYVGGYIAESEELPDSVVDVLPQETSIQEMRHIANKWLEIPKGRQAKFLETGRAYRPFLSCGHPIIDKIPLHKLVGEIPSDCEGPGGVFLNVGHGCDGITLGPGSGYVMSEMILGKQIATDISGLRYPCESMTSGFKLER